MVGAAAGDAGQVLQVVFSSLGLFVAVIVALVVGILVYRGRHRPGSRMRAVIDAGFAAVPGVIALIAGVVGIFVGIAYFFILFFYWLIYFIVASIWVSIVGGRVTYPAEFGQIAGQGFIYLGLGLLVSVLGLVWLGLVITRAVHIARRRIGGTTYTTAPPAGSAGALTAGPPSGPIPPMPPPLEPLAPPSWPAGDPPAKPTRPSTRRAPTKQPSRPSRVGAAKSPPSGSPRKSGPPTNRGGKRAGG